MQKLKLILLFFILPSVYISAQSDGSENTIYKNGISAQIGYNYGLLKDLKFSPLHYTDGGLIYKLDYNRETTKSRFSIKTNYSDGLTKTGSLDSITSQFITGAFRVKYLQKSARQLLDKFHLSFGGQYHFNIYYLTWGEGQDSFGFLANHSLDFSTQLNYQLNHRSRIQIGLDIPLFNLIVRPSYNIVDQELITNNAESVHKLATIMAC